MRWYHAVIVAAGLALGGLLSGGIYRTEVVHREGTPNMVIRSNRVTGHVDVAGPYSSAFWDWERLFASPPPAPETPADARR